MSRLMRSYRQARAGGVAVELGVAERLAAGPRSGASPPAARPFVDWRCRARRIRPLRADAIRRRDEAGPPRSIGPSLQLRASPAVVDPSGPLDQDRGALVRPRLRNAELGLLRSASR